MTLTILTIILVLLGTLAAIAFLNTRRCTHKWTDIWVDPAVKLSSDAIVMTVAQRCDKCGFVRIKKKKVTK